MATAGDVVQLAFEDLAVVQPGETISTTLQTDGFKELNSLLGSLSAERYTVFTQILGNFNLIPNISSYQMGVGGTFGTSTRAQRAEAWSAFYQNYRTGGAVLSFPEFQAQAQDRLGSTANIPQIVGADEAWPLLNVRVFPTPSFSPGTIEIAYWSPLTQFATVADVLNLPDGWFEMLHTNLAVKLYPKYARVGGMTPELAANAQNAKLSLVQQNSPEQQPQATGAQ